MRVLVTGITGFIGYSLAERLVKEGYKVYGIARFVSTGRRVPEGATVMTADLTDYYSVEKVVEEVRPEFVFHLAALTPVSESFKVPSAYFDVNVKGTMNLCHALLKHASECLQGFLFAGTTEMFDCETVINEVTPFSPTSPYAVSKIAAHYYLQYLWKTYRFPAVTIVPTNTYGRAKVGQRHFVIEKIITEMLLGREVILMGRPDTVRDFMFRDDHVDAYMRVFNVLSDNNKRDWVTGSMFCFGTGVGYTIAEVFGKIKEIIGWDGKVVWNVFRRPNEPKKIVVDASHARAVLGWTPRYTLEEGLRKAIEEWREALGL